MDDAEAIDSQIKRRMSEIDFADTGTIIAVNSVNYTVDVMIHGTANQGLIKDVTVMSQIANENSGLISMPKIEDNVIILYLEPKKQSPVVIGSYYSGEPYDTTENIYTIQHSSGAYIKIDEDGNIILHPASGKKIKFIS